MPTWSAVFFDPVTGAAIGIESLGKAMLVASRGCLPRFERVFLVPLRCVGPFDAYQRGC